MWPSYPVLASLARMSGSWVLSDSDSVVVGGGGGGGHEEREPGLFYRQHPLHVVTGDGTRHGDR